MPTGSQLALLFQHKPAGTISGLLGSMQFGFGAIVTAITGASSSASGFGLVSIIAVCALITALACLILLPKQLPQASH